MAGKKIRNPEAFARSVKRKQMRIDREAAMSAGRIPGILQSKHGGILQVSSADHALLVLHDDGLLGARRSRGTAGERQSLARKALEIATTQGLVNCMSDNRGVFTLRVPQTGGMTSVAPPDYWRKQAYTSRQLVQLRQWEYI